MIHTINDKIRRGFSHSAKQYDLFSSLHREIGDRLFVQVSREVQPSALLDVGCGTGYLTGKIKDHFSKSQIIGLDFAQGMLEEARAKREDIAWVLGNGNHLPFADGQFDILTSNLAYQWAGDLLPSFQEAWRVLSPKGVFVGNLFGYSTCQELFQSLDEVKKGTLQFTRLPDESQAREALDLSRFKDFKVDSERIKLEFKDMHELIAWLKSIGANNLSREGFVGPKAMSLADAVYQKRFSYQQGVAATFEVIWFYGKK